jgi:hypothetical protein
MREGLMGVKEIHHSQKLHVLDPRAAGVDLA